MDGGASVSRALDLPLPTIPTKCGKCPKMSQLLRVYSSIKILDVCNIFSCLGWIPNVTVAKATSQIRGWFVRVALVSLIALDATSYDNTTFGMLGVLR